MGDKWDDELGKPIKTSRLRRALKFGSVAARVAGGFVKRKLSDSPNDAEESFDALADSALEQAKHIVAMMGEMKGAAMKVGQMLSTDPELLSKDFSDALSSLQRNAPPMDYGSLVKQIEDAFDRPITDVFSYFDPEPIGSASIGQVHRAKLHNGQEVAVKVQYPGVADCIDSDLKNVRALLSVGRTLIHPDRADEIIEEARKTITIESDYEQECRNIQLFRKRHKHDERIRIPKPFPKWTRKTVLTMEYMKGTPLEDTFHELSVNERDQLAAVLVRFFVIGFHREFEVHVDPHPGNFLVDAECRLIVLDFGCVKRFEPETADGILHLLVDVWAGEFEKVVTRLKAMGFGAEDTVWPATDVMGEYLQVLLKPLLEDEPFYFSGFQVAPEIRRYVVKHPQILKLVPPANLLMYFRTTGGLKGILARSGAGINLYRLARECAAERGISG